MTTQKLETFIEMDFTHSKLTTEGQIDFALSAAYENDNVICYTPTSRGKVTILINSPHTYTEDILQEIIRFQFGFRDNQIRLETINSIPEIQKLYDEGVADYATWEENFNTLKVQANQSITNLLRKLPHEPKEIFSEYQDFNLHEREFYFALHWAMVMELYKGRGYSVDEIAEVSSFAAGATGYVNVDITRKRVIPLLISHWKHGKEIDIWYKGTTKLAMRWRCLIDEKAQQGTLTVEDIEQTSVQVLKDWDDSSVQQFSGLKPSHPAFSTAVQYLLSLEIFHHKEVVATWYETRQDLSLRHLSNWILDEFAESSTEN